jgi:hypothetical protein
VVQVLCFDGAVPAAGRRVVEDRLRDLAARSRAEGVVRFSDIVDLRWPEPEVLVWRTPYLDNPDDPAGLRALHELLTELAAGAPRLVAWNGRALWGG